jgi:hypothetical protein
VTLAAIVALAALALAAFSLTRLSRLPKAPPPPAEDRTFASLRAGDVVLTPDGDWLVEARSELSEPGARADLFTLRSGRDRRWLLVPPEGAVALAAEQPRTPHVDRAAGARKLDRSTIDLLPGA